MQNTKTIHNEREKHAKNEVLLFLQKTSFSIVNKSVPVIPNFDGMNNVDNNVKAVLLFVKLLFEALCIFKKEI